MSLSPLAKLFSDCVIRALDKRVAIAFSGGLDSAAIARVACNHAEVVLITMSAGEDSPDLLAAREAAKEMDLPLREVILEDNDIANLAEQCQTLMPGTLTDLELMVGTMAVARVAHEEKCKILLTGSGAEETFIGYNKYYEARKKGLELQPILDEEIRTLPSRDLLRAKMVCAKWKVEVRTPFLDAQLVEAVRQIPVAERMGTLEMKKPLLRKIALELGVPRCARERPKKAMQYGSKVHAVMEKMWKKGLLKTEPNKVPDWLKEV